MFKNVLLCTHGTEGAQKAEAFFFNEAAKNPDLQLTVLTVLDADWRLMTGDDWLNSSKTHTTFLDHVEDQVSEEIVEEWQRIKECYPEAKKARFMQHTGDIAETITGVAKALECDLIVIGPYSKNSRFFPKKAEKGLRDRMENKQLHPLLPCPLLIAP